MNSLSYPQESKKNRFLLAALLGSLTALAPLAMDMYLPALPNISPVTLKQARRCLS